MGIEDLLDLFSCRGTIAFADLVQRGRIDRVVKMQAMPAFRQFDRRFGQVLSGLGRAVHGVLSSSSASWFQVASERTTNWRVFFRQLRSF